jgi:hypothetical protein
LQTAIGRWFFFSSLTGRYTSSTESVMDADLNRIKGITNPDAFLAVLNELTSNELTNDYWAITLPSQLATSSARNPQLFAYIASQNRIGENRPRNTWRTSGSATKNGWLGRVRVADSDRGQEDPRRDLGAVRGRGRSSPLRGRKPISIVCDNRRIGTVELDLHAVVEQAADHRNGVQYGRKHAEAREGRDPVEQKAIELHSLVLGRQA